MTQSGNLYAGRGYSGDALRGVDRSATDQPDASIIVPSYNRPDRLQACLAALSLQQGVRCEVIVVDDGSSAPLAPVVDAFGPGFRCLRQANAGPAAARNAGAAAARGPFLAFTDDDCTPGPGWVAALIAAQAGDTGRLIGGQVENVLTENVYAAASQSLCDYLYAYFGAAEGDMPFFTSNNIGCDRTRFLAMGGFDASFPLAAGEDRDFGLRWRAAGGSLVFAPPARVGHAHALTLRRFWRQHANYGRGARHLHRLMTGRGDPTPKVERPGFYSGLIAYPLRSRSPSGLTQSALLALSQVAMVAGYFAGFLSGGAR